MDGTTQSIDYPCASGSYAVCANSASEEKTFLGGKTNVYAFIGLGKAWYLHGQSVAITVPLTCIFCVQSHTFSFVYCTTIGEPATPVAMYSQVDKDNPPLYTCNLHDKLLAACCAGKLVNIFLTFNSYLLTYILCTPLLKPASTLLF